jgi:glycosyltransferase involved in cell wall biosynthesis
MKILHLIYDDMHNPWVGGGGAVRVFEINRRLSARGHQITVVSGMYPGAHDRAEGNMEFKHVGSAGGYVLSTFSYAFSAHKYLKRHYLNYDVVIEDFAPWNPVFSFTLKERPVILQLQNYLGRAILSKYFIAGVPFYLAERMYPKYFSRWIVLVDKLNERFHIEGEVIPQGINREDLVENHTGGTYAAYLGRIDIHQKGLDILSDAMKGLPALLKVAGDGRDRKRFLRMVKSRKNIEWVGVVRGGGKIGFLGNAQFLVVPSRFEGQGIVVLEAAACGKPVIVSDIPELSYAVDAGFGLSFRTGDPEDLADKIRFLLDNQTLREQMGKKAIGYARNFTWDKIAGEYERYLLDVVNASGRKAG